jgi:hypothetical protein
MNAPAATLLILTASLLACEERRPAPVVDVTAPALREPEVFLRALFHRLGVRSLSECEAVVPSNEVNRYSEETGEELAERREKLARDVYADEHAHFRATVAAASGVLPGFAGPPLVIDGNLACRDSDSAESDDGARLLVNVVATAPDRALVDVFWTRGSIHPAERCFTAEFRDGTWNLEQGYASFCEAFAPWQAAR